MESIVFEGIVKDFGTSRALDSVSFSIRKGEFFSILGPSGCGKTTLLRILAGFEVPQAGRVLLDGQDITFLPPNRRPVNTVFQNYALFPHLTVWENIAFGLRIARKPEHEVAEAVKRMLQLIQLQDHAYKKPNALSGGQKQRVAIARALINRPQILLLDEPLAALDLKLRQKMLLDLDRIHDEVGITFIFITHDQTEAMAVSDRLAVLHKGKLEQLGTPKEIYETPMSGFVASFIGDTNFFNGAVLEVAQKDYSLVQVDGFHNILCYNDKKISQGDAVHLTVRPEKIRISKEAPPDVSLQNVFKGTVDDVVYKGDHTYFGVLVGEKKISVVEQHRRCLLDEASATWGDRVYIWWHADNGFMLERYQGGEEAYHEG